MTVQPIRPPVFTGHVAAARGAVESAAAVTASTLTVDELTDGISEVAALESQAAALKLALLAEADSRRIARELGATGTDAWAAPLTGSTRAVMAGGVWLARLLEERYDATRAAFAAGGIIEAQVRVIVQAAEKLPEGVTDEQRRVAEAGLVAKAVEGMDARRLRQAARRMLSVVSRELADRHEADLLHAEERRAENETWMRLSDNGDGTFSGRFTIPELHGHLLLAALERLTAPNRLSRNKAGEVVEDDTLVGEGPTVPYPERLGLGFTELIEHLPADGFGRNGATVIVHLDYQHLLDGLASARLDTGTRISAGEARRLACEAGLVPAVLGGRSEPLDVGFEQRLHNLAMRRGLSVEYDTCAVEGCERPFAWCDIHHPHAWSRGGRTSLANGLPLCPHHHRRAHDSRFDLSRLPSGEVRFTRRR
ncbi:MAG: DUF222 domain-containing protein [Nocardioidaceae bacterium]